MSKRYSDDIWDDEWAEPEEERKPKQSSFSFGERPRGEDDWWSDSPAPAPTPRKKSGGLPWGLIMIVLAAVVLLQARGDKSPPPDVADTDPPYTYTTPTVDPNLGGNPIVTNPTPTPTPALAREYRYFAKQLTVEERLAYDRVLTALSAYDGEIKDVRLTSVDQLRKVMEAVYWDNPEIFWYRGVYSSYYYDRGGYLEINITPTYVWDKQTGLGNKAYVEAVTHDMIVQLQGKSEYEIVKGVWDILVDRTAYDYAYTGTTIFDFLHDRRGVCEGYARTTQYLLTKLGMECLYVVGRGHSEEHAWNIVKVGGQYYQLDVTWGDPLYDDGHQTKNYNYLLVTNEEMYRAHSADWSRYPNCTATAYNYHVYEGHYLQYYDMALLKQWAAEARQTGEPLMFKCANQAVFNDTKKRLVTNKEVWTMLEGMYNQNTRVSHSINEDLYIITYTIEW